MRAIAKQGSGGYHLTRAHTKPPKTDSQATSRWSSFGHKEALLQSLLAEQCYLCCYSELRADQMGLGYHIEHVENKSQNPARTFDYANLAASALHSTSDLPVFLALGYEVFGGTHPESKPPLIRHALFPATSPIASAILPICPMAGLFPRAA